MQDAATVGICFCLGYILGVVDPLVEDPNGVELTKGYGFIDVGCIVEIQIGCMGAIAQIDIQIRLGVSTWVALPIAVDEDGIAGANGKGFGSELRRAAICYHNKNTLCVGTNSGA
jgi:hypothetical protein